MTLHSPFERDNHVFESPKFREFIHEVIEFFTNTPVNPLPPGTRFSGQGVYALYYNGESPYYKPLSQMNANGYIQPIYIGKAVPKGHRMGRAEGEDEKGRELYSRLRKHSRTINGATNLNLDDFRCRFMILEGSGVHMIGIVESALIRHFMPIWNTMIDGFGNNDPGKGRYEQKKSEWDILHPGRRWADKCKGESHTLQYVEAQVDYYFKFRK